LSWELFSFKVTGLDHPRDLSRPCMRPAGVVGTRFIASSAFMPPKNHGIHAAAPYHKLGIHAAAPRRSRRGLHDKET
jgi:hypothetical protein